MTESAAQSRAAGGGFVRKLGLFDVTMIVMGGIIGAGIFMNPSVVSRQVHTPFLMLGAWVLGGIAALFGAFIYAELAWRLPKVGGQYAYISDAIHPLPAFMYGWSALLVIQSGGMAAVAVTFSRYFLELTGFDISDKLVAVATVAILTVVNCFGVRSGGTLQNILMVLKIAAIAMLVGVGLFWAPHSHLTLSPVLDRPASFGLLTAFGAAMVPVLFAYGGWQTTNFVAEEIREPERNLPLGLILGVIGVVALYVLVNVVCINVLGTDGLASTVTPASAVMRQILGERGAQLIAVGIAISTLGFLSQTILTAPRLYYAMAQDGLFFKRIAQFHPKTHVPVMAIILQGAICSIVAVSGKYDDILNYVVSVDFIFFGLSATCLFAFRKRERLKALQGSAEDSVAGVRASGIRSFGHPWTTIFFVAVCWLVVADTIYSYPQNTLIGLCFLVTGVPVFYIWRFLSRRVVKS